MFLEGKDPGAEIFPIETLIIKVQFKDCPEMYVDLTHEEISDEELQAYIHDFVGLLRELYNQAKTKS